MGLCYFSGSISTFFNINELQNVFICLSTIFLASSIYMIPMIQLKRQLLFKEIVKIDIIKDIFNIGIALILALLGWGYWSIISGQIGSYFIATLLIRKKTQWTPRVMFNQKAFRALKGVALWNFCVVQVNLLAEQMDKLLIGKFLGPSQLGFYDKAFSIGNMPLMFISRNISSVAFSTFSRHQDDQFSLGYYLSRFMVLNTIVSFPFYIGLFSIADQFVLVFLGGKWGPMIPSFKILLLAFMISSVTAIIDNLNLSCGYHRQLAKFRIVSTLFLVAGLFGAVKISIEAVCVTIIAYYAILLIGSLFIVQKIVSLGYREVARLLFPAISGSLVIFISVKLAEKLWLPHLTFFDLLMLIGIGALSYCLYMIVLNFENCRFIRSEMISFMGKILKR